MKSLKVTQLFKDKKSLITVMAQMCHFAQEHVGDPDAWDHNDLEAYMICPSYQISCFLAQNTKEGNQGVEWEIVHEQLCEMPVKSIAKWEKIIGDLVEDFGGLKA